ncbi:MAG: hypothetical protein J3Q66DRAFT_35758 [Benniella sp.]|nr:MAG: hypothetical protein J3Q66DRAFT_35758 [Benniella sp.]
MTHPPFKVKRLTEEVVGPSHRLAPICFPLACPWETGSDVRHHLSYKRDRACRVSFFFAFLPSASPGSPSSQLSFLPTHSCSTPSACCLHPCSSEVPVDARLSFLPTHSCSLQEPVDTHADFVPHPPLVCLLVDKGCQGGKARGRSVHPCGFGPRKGVHPRPPFVFGHYQARPNLPYNTAPAIQARCVGSSSQ